MIRFALFVMALVCVVVGMESVAHAFTPPVPEIDAGSAASALSVLGAGFLMLRSRFRK